MAREARCQKRLEKCICYGEFVFQWLTISRVSAQEPGMSYAEDVYWSLAKNLISVACI